MMEEQVTYRQVGPYSPSIDFDHDFEHRFDEHEHDGRVAKRGPTLRLGFSLAERGATLCDGKMPSLRRPEND